MDGVSTLVLMRSERRRIPFLIDRQVLGELLRAGLPVCVNVMSSQTLQRGVNLILGLTAGAHAVGMFNLAMRIIDLPRSAIYNGLMSYALPVFARRSAEPARLIGVIGDSTAISGFVLTPLFFGIALTAKDIILLIFGAKWADAIPLLQVLACTAALGNLALYATTALVAVNRTHLTLKAEVATTLLALVLVYLLGATYGGMAAALALLLRMLLITLLLSVQLPQPVRLAADGRRGDVGVAPNRPVRLRAPGRRHCHRHADLCLGLQPAAPALAARIQVGVYRPLSCISSQWSTSSCAKPR
jgi:O-antigen/teichoic acid export membrane protein